MTTLTEIKNQIDLIEESSKLWKFHRYVEFEKRWNALFILPFKHMWE